MAGAHDYARYIAHPDDHEPESTISLDAIPLDKLKAAVNASAMTNQQRVDAAICKADSNSWQIAHPEFLQTANNTRLMNHWLETNGKFDNFTYPDLDAAFESFRGSGLLDLDEAELARDKRTPRSYRGLLSKQTTFDLGELIGAERQAALAQMAGPSGIERAIENLPIDEAQALLRNAERVEQAQANRAKVQFTADAFLLLRPEIVDDVRNAKLIMQQLQANGDSPTIENFDKAAQQLRKSGLLRLTQAEVAKQHKAALDETAAVAAKSLFDRTSEAEMYNLPIDELRRRANGNFSGV